MEPTTEIGSADFEAFLDSYLARLSAERQTEEDMKDFLEAFTKFLTNSRS